MAIIYADGLSNTKHYTVFEFIEKIEQEENNTQNVSDEGEIEQEENDIQNVLDVSNEKKIEQDENDTKMYVFAKKLIDCSFINSFDNNIIKDVNITLRQNKMNRNILKLKVENKKVKYFYSNNDIIYFIKMLYAASTKRNFLYEFLKISDVSNIIKNLYYSNIFFYETNYLDIEGLDLKLGNVLDILKYLGLMEGEYKEEFYLLSGCALLLYELRESAGDIDICVSEKAFNMLNSKFTLEHCAKNKYRIGNLVEIFVNKKEDFKCKTKKGFLVEDLKIILDSKNKRKQHILGTKKAKKDMVDIYMIDKYLAYHKNY